MHRRWRTGDEEHAAAVVRLGWRTERCCVAASLRRHLMRHATPTATPYRAQINAFCATPGRFVLAAQGIAPTMTGGIRHQEW